MGNSSVGLNLPRHNLPLRNSLLDSRLQASPERLGVTWKMSRKVCVAWVHPKMPGDTSAVTVTGCVCSTGNARCAAQWLCWSMSPQRLSSKLFPDSLVTRLAHRLQAEPLGEPEELHCVRHGHSPTTPCGT